MDMGAKMLELGRLSREIADNITEARTARQLHVAMVINRASDSFCAVCGPCGGEWPGLRMHVSGPVSVIGKTRHYDDPMPDLLLFINRLW